MSRFKPGQSGNPGGRPKAPWTMTGLIKEALEEEAETGQQKKKLVAQKLAQLALKGDMMAIKEVNNRIDGMAQQNMKVDSEVTITFDSSLKQDE